MVIFSEAPVRLCCGQRHWTVECPDGRVMCSICFDRVAKDILMKDTDGTLWNICQGCGLIENLWACFLAMSGGLRRDNAN